VPRHRGGRCSGVSSRGAGDGAVGVDGSGADAVVGVGREGRGWRPLQMPAKAPGWAWSASTLPALPGEPVHEGLLEQSRRSIRATHPMPSVVTRQPAVVGINTLLLFAGILTIRDMKTTREWEEANTVEGNTLALETQLRHARRSVARCRRNYPWSQPSLAIMPTALGISYAFGNGQVPV
jgi:hypothetical protein